MRQGPPGGRGGGLLQPVTARLYLVEEVTGVMRAAQVVHPQSLLGVLVAAPAKQVVLNGEILLSVGNELLRFCRLT
jgi:hypothetical protein